MACFHFSSGLVIAWPCSPAMKRLFSFHSLVVGKVAVLLIAIVKVVTGLEDVDGKVTSTSNAIVKVAKLLMVVGLVT